MTHTVDTLAPGDEAALEAYLAARAETSMFLRSNVARAGIVDRGEAYQATYVAARAAADRSVRGVVAHGWNGLLLLQAPVDLVVGLAQAAAARSGRAVKGMVGPWAQVEAVRDGLGYGDARLAMNSREVLFALALDALVVPPPLTDGRLRCRPPVAEELPLLTAWRIAYSIEALGATDGPALHAQAADGIEAAFRGKTCWVLTEGDDVVAYSGFNAQLPEMVQIGGVFTPPARRGRGYARAVVAGSLVAARERGVTRAILFTGDDNAPAKKAYLSLGFRVVGDYGIVLLATD